MRLADAAGLDVLAARGGELERDFAYGVVRQLLERHVGRADRQQRERWLEGAAALAGPLLGLATERHVGDDPTAAALHGLYWLTANLSADTPLLVAVDDLHWVDGASLRFLAYLARRVGGAPGPAARRQPPAGRIACAGAGRGVRRRPERLAGRAGAAQPRRRPRPGDETRSRRARRVLSTPRPAATRSWSARCWTCWTSGWQPTTFRVVGARSVIRFVAGRLGRLGPDAQALARAVAVLGTDVEPRHAYAIAELTERRRRCRPRTRWSRPASSPPSDRSSSSTRSFATAVAEQLSPPERARRHLAAAHLLERDGGDAERLAPHLLAADARADPWVVETLRHGGGTFERAWSAGRCRPLPAPRPRRTAERRRPPRAAGPARPGRDPRRDARRRRRAPPRRHVGDRLAARARPSWRTTSRSA